MTQTMYKLLDQQAYNTRFAYWRTLAESLIKHHGGDVGTELVNKFNGYGCDEMQITSDTCASYVPYLASKNNMAITNTVMYGRRSLANALDFSLFMAHERIHAVQFNKADIFYNFPAATSAFNFEKYQIYSPASYVMLIQTLEIDAYGKASMIVSDIASMDEIPMYSGSFAYNDVMGYQAAHEKLANTSGIENVLYTSGFITLENHMQKQACYKPRATLQRYIAQMPNIEASNVEIVRLSHADIHKIAGAIGPDWYTAVKHDEDKPLNPREALFLKMDKDEERMLNRLNAQLGITNEEDLPTLQDFER